jgi:hypothetical protein
VAGRGAGNSRPSCAGGIVSQPAMFNCEPTGSEPSQEGSPQMPAHFVSPGNGVGSRFDFISSFSIHCLKPSRPLLVIPVRGL